MHDQDIMSAVLFFSATYKPEKVVDNEDAIPFFSL